MMLLHELRPNSFQALLCGGDDMPVMSVLQALGNTADTNSSQQDAEHVK